MVRPLDLLIVIEIVDGGSLRHELKTFDVQAGRGFVFTAIVNVHFLHSEIAHVIRLITATFGGNVDERLIKIGQKFEICFDGSGSSEIIIVVRLLDYTDATCNRR